MPKYPQFIALLCNLSSSSQIPRFLLTFHSRNSSLLLFDWCLLEIFYASIAIQSTRFLNWELDHSVISSFYLLALQDQIENFLKLKSLCFLQKIAGVVCIALSHYPNTRLHISLLSRAEILDHEEWILAVSLDEVYHFSTLLCLGWGENLFACSGCWSPFLELDWDYRWDFTFCMLLFFSHIHCSAKSLGCVILSYWWLMWYMHITIAKTPY